MKTLIYVLVLIGTVLSSWVILWAIEKVLYGKLKDDNRKGKREIQRD